MDLKSPRVLYTAADINAKVLTMGQEISQDFDGLPFTVIGISNGAIPFVADLIRAIRIPLQLDIIIAHSYAGEESTGTVTLRTSDLKTDVSNRHVLLIDDILDTGRTLSYLVEWLEAFGPASIKTCVLLNKPSRREVGIEPDYYGFEIPDEFVVGYGLDYDEYYRNLDYIGVLGD